MTTETNRQKIEAMNGRGVELDATIHSLRAMLAAVKGGRRVEKARARLLAGVCFLFGAQAMNRRGLMTPAVKVALRDQERRLIELFGDPLAGSDCVADALYLMRDGYRSSNKTLDDLMREGSAKMRKSIGLGSVA